MNKIRLLFGLLLIEVLTLWFLASQKYASICTPALDGMGQCIDYPEGILRHPQAAMALSLVVLATLLLLAAETIPAKQKKKVAKKAKR